MVTLVFIQQRFDTNSGSNGERADVVLTATVERSHEVGETQIGQAGSLLILLTQEMQHRFGVINQLSGGRHGG